MSYKDYCDWHKIFKVPSWYHKITIWEYDLKNKLKNIEHYC